MEESVSTPPAGIARPNGDLRLQFVGKSRMVLSPRPGAALPGSYLPLSS